MSETTAAPDVKAAYDVLIIGAVAAGTKAAAKARRQDVNISIAMVTDEEYISYAGCGLAYYLSGKIQDESQLVVRTAQQFEEAQNVKMFIKTRATSINPDEKTVTVVDLETNEEYKLGYDKLVIATGARPVLPPFPGADLERVTPLRSVSHAKQIREWIEAGEVKHAVVIGGGYIGVEVAENLVERGIDTVLVELMDHVLPNFDDDMAHFAQQQMEEHGVKVFCKTKAEEIIGENGRAVAVKTTAGTFPADLVVVAVGVRPNVKLARDAGIEIGDARAIKVDARMETSIKDIYAAGDCVECIHLLTGEPVWQPLGSIANRQGRTVGINVTGGHDRQEPILQSLVVKIFDLNFGRTGLSKEQALKAGYDPVTVVVPTHDIAHYFPGNKEIIIKLTADRNTGKLLGAYVVGEGVVDKTLDTFIMAMTCGGTAWQLAKTDLAYAPPYSMAMSAAIVACNVMYKKLMGELEGYSADEFQALRKSGKDFYLLDVRTEEEFMLRSIPGSVNICIDELPRRLEEIPKDRDIVITCSVGHRSWRAYRLLKAKGIGKSVVMLEGGLTAWPYEVE